MTEKIKRFYRNVQSKIDCLDFERIWPGFRQMPFALYDLEMVCYQDRLFPPDNRFTSNTTIDFEGTEIAILYIDWEIDNDTDVVAADVVHEMFHSFQHCQGESRFPDELIRLALPDKLEHFNFKYSENQALRQVFLESVSAKRKEHFLEFTRIRSARKPFSGDGINFEYAIETIEGSAEYAGLKALEQLSKERYRSRIKSYVDRMGKVETAFDARRNGYWTGVLFLLLLDELSIEFPKELDVPHCIYESVIKSDAKAENMSIPMDGHIADFFQGYLKRKEATVNDFLQSNPKKRKGKFRLVGFDPNNLFKWQRYVYCKTFMLLEVNGTEKRFVPGPVLLETEETDFRKAAAYYSAEHSDFSEKETG